MISFSVGSGDSDRDDLRYQAMLDRGGETSCTCDWCLIISGAVPKLVELFPWLEEEMVDANAALGTDYHENFPRSMIYGDSEARELSYVPELCSWLCNYHHIGVVHGRISRSKIAPVLLMFNALYLYSPERVKAALDALQASVKYVLPIELPL